MERKAQRFVICLPPKMHSFPHYQHPPHWWTHIDEHHNMILHKNIVGDRGRVCHAGRPLLDSYPRENMFWFYWFIQIRSKGHRDLPSGVFPARTWALDTGWIFHIPALGQAMLTVSYKWDVCYQPKVHICLTWDKNVFNFLPLREKGISILWNCFLKIRYRFFSLGKLSAPQNLLNSWKEYFLMDNFTLLRYWK